MNAYRSMRRYGLGDTVLPGGFVIPTTPATSSTPSTATTSSTSTTTPSTTNWVMWGSVAVLVGVGGYLYFKRH
jgi:hypothetical protein